MTIIRPSLSYLRQVKLINEYTFIYVWNNDPRAGVPGLNKHVIAFGLLDDHDISRFVDHMISDLAWSNGRSLHVTFAHLDQDS